MIYRYKSKTGKFMDVDIPDADRVRIDQAMSGAGFALVCANPRDKVLLMPFAEFSRAISGEGDGPQLKGPQPGGGVGPVGGLGVQRRGSGIAIPI